MILSKWILIPIGALMGLVLLVSYVFDYPEYSWLLIPLVVALAIVYVLHQEIDRWYVRKHPQKLPKGMIRFVRDHMPLYRLMNSSQNELFENATSLFLRSTTFMPQGFDNVPEDLKVVVAANAHILTAFRPEWHKKFEEYANVVIYRHPFPSPQFTEYLHASELYVQDKVVLFCADHFMKAFRFRQQYFNTAMYEWAKVILLDNQTEFKVDLKALPEISGFQNSDIVEYIGLPDAYINWEAVAITYFFTFPVRYSMYMEMSYPIMAEFFNMDPIVLMNAKP